MGRPTSIRRGFKFRIAEQAYDDLFDYEEMKVRNETSLRDLLSLERPYEDLLA